MPSEDAKEALEGLAKYIEKMGGARDLLEGWVAVRKKSGASGYDFKQSRKANAKLFKSKAAVAAFLGVKDESANKAKNKRETVFGQPLGDSFFCGPQGWSPIGSHIFKINNAARLGCVVLARPESTKAAFETVTVKDVDDAGNVTFEFPSGSDELVPYLQVMKRVKLEKVRT